MPKTVIIPLWNEDSWETIVAVIRTQAEGSSEIAISYTARYLWFMIGPGKGSSRSSSI